MNKYKLFKCKKAICYCNQSWIIARGDTVIEKFKDFDRAFKLVTGQW